MGPVTGVEQHGLGPGQDRLESVLVGWVGQVLDALVFGLLTLDAEVAPGSGLLTAVIMIGCGVVIALITAHTPERGSPTLAARDPLERTGHR